MNKFKNTLSAVFVPKKDNTKLIGDFQALLNDGVKMVYRSTICSALENGVIISEFTEDAVPANQDFTVSCLNIVLLYGILV